MLPLELKRHSRAPSSNFQLRLHRSRGKQGNQHGSRGGKAKLKALRDCGHLAQLHQCPASRSGLVKQLGLKE